MLQKRIILKTSSRLLTRMYSRAISLKQSQLMTKDQCILVDENDNQIGIASKFMCKLFLYSRIGHNVMVMFQVIGFQMVLEILDYFPFIVHLVYFYSLLLINFPIIAIIIQITNYFSNSAPLQRQHFL